MAEFAVILAGGQGTRLWPLSRAARPKQFLALAPGGRTLLQEAVRRTAVAVGAIERVWVLVQASQAELARQQLPELPEENLICEPVGRNTAASLGLAALHLQRRAPGAVMGVFPADHLYHDEAPWQEAVAAALAHANAHRDLVTIGIPPESPSDQYGYILLGARLTDSQPDSCPVFRAQRFVEKPDRATAQAYLNSGAYLWNTGTFAWQVETFLEALQRHLPQLYAGLQPVTADWERLAEVYPALPAISVDYGILERCANEAVVRGNFQRLDVGTLASLSELLPSDAAGNASSGDLLARDSRANIVFSDDGLVGLIGVENLIVVRQGDVLLVCPKERAGEVKELVAQLQNSEKEEWRRLL
jgi:mannose-1-phosphate guanylyltransferase